MEQGVVGLDRCVATKTNPFWAPFARALVMCGCPHHVAVRQLLPGCVLLRVAGIQKNEAVATHG